MKVRILNLEIESIRFTPESPTSCRGKHFVLVRNIFTGKNTHFDYTCNTSTIECSEAKCLIECLLRDAVGSTETFEDWCLDFGQDPKNLDDLNTYTACKKIHSQLEYLNFDLNIDMETLEDAEAILINEPSLSSDDEYFITI